MTLISEIIKVNIKIVKYFIVISYNAMNTVVYYISTMPEIVSLIELHKLSRSFSKYFKTWRYKLYRI